MSTKTRRLIIHHTVPLFDQALQTASWKLNIRGMKNFHECLTMAESRKEHMKLEGNTVVEVYTGRNTAPYQGKYTTDGTRCNCSWFKSRLMCRHPFYYRLMTNMPLFDSSMFHPSLLKDPEPDIVIDDNIKTDEEAPAIDVSAGGSPGMEHLITQQQEANRKLKKRRNSIVLLIHKK